MRIKAETIEKYVEERAKNHPDGHKFTGANKSYPYLLGVLTATLEGAFANPQLMRELKRDLIKLQEESKPMKNINALLADSHRRQFAGEDWQSVAIDLAEPNGIKFESEEYTKLQSSPDPGCECGFCQQAEWN